MDKIINKIETTISTEKSNYFTYARQVKIDTKHLRETVDKFGYPPKFFVMESDDFFCLVLAGVAFTYGGNAIGSIKTKSFRKENGFLVPDSKNWEFATVFSHDLYNHTEKDKKINIAKLDAVMKRLSKLSGSPDKVIDFVVKVKNEAVRWQ